MLELISDAVRPVLLVAPIKASGTDKQTVAVAR